ncbi:MAG: glycosyltransferase family 61 protein [Verrucomicrobiota bacterium]
MEIPEIGLKLINRLSWRIQRSLNLRAPVIKRLDECVKLNQSNFTLISSGFNARHTLPVEINGKNHKYFEEALDYSVEDNYLLKLSDVIIKSERGLLHLPKIGYSFEHINRMPWHIEGSSDYTKYSFSTRKITEPSYSLIGLCPGAHYHLFSDILQRLVSVIEHLPNEVKFICPSNANNAFLEFIRQLGINRKNLIFPRKFENLLIKTLYWSPARTLSRFQCPQTVKQINKLKRHFADDRKYTSSSAIYISRNDAKSRRITNEHQLIKRLEDHGVKTYCLAGLSVKEQISIFHNARQIIAPHGAGLVNLLFASSGTSVLELFPEKLHLGCTCYWSISNCLGLKYSYAVCDSQNPISPNSDFVVSINSILAWLSMAE